MRFYQIRFEETVITLVDVWSTNSWRHFKNGVVEACDKIVGRRVGRKPNVINGRGTESIKRQYEGRTMRTRRCAEICQCPRWIWNVSLMGSMNSGVNLNGEGWYQEVQLLLSYEASWAFYIVCSHIYARCSIKFDNNVGISATKDDCAKRGLHFVLC